MEYYWFLIKWDFLSPESINLKQITDEVFIGMKVLLIRGFSFSESMKLGQIEFDMELKEKWKKLDISPVVGAELC